MDAMVKFGLALKYLLIIDLGVEILFQESGLLDVP
jgi:hypothetical protein